MFLNTESLNWKNINIIPREIVPEIQNNTVQNDKFLWIPGSLQKAESINNENWVKTSDWQPGTPELFLLFGLAHWDHFRNGLWAHNRNFLFQLWWCLQHKHHYKFLLTIKSIFKFYYKRTFTITKMPCRIQVVQDGIRNPVNVEYVPYIKVTV